MIYFYYKKLMCPLRRSRTKSLSVGLANAFALSGEANLLANLVALFVSPRFFGPYLSLFI